MPLEPSLRSSDSWFSAVWRCALLVAALAFTASGCFSPSYKSGDLQCGRDGACPAGYQCEANRCYRAGDGPDLAAAGVGGGPSDGDLGTNADLSQPPIVVPPASVFVSCGGGSSAAASGAALNLSVPGIAVGGTSIASSGASVSFGYFANASVQ